MRLKNIELWASALAILIITALYLSVTARSSIPAASSRFGHGIGIAGFALMLMTETLYSLRKRYQFARWGKLQNWLSFHIFTGLVGPFMVLLHTSWKFQGLAGVLMLLTVIIVGSGFIGRYVYTAIPRSIDGKELGLDQVQELLVSNLEQIDTWKRTHLSEASADPYGHYLTSPATGLDKKRFFKELIAEGIGQEAVLSLKDLLSYREGLEKQAANLEKTRKVLAIWHAVHVPLALSMFLVAAVHILATLYFSTLLK